MAQTHQQFVKSFRALRKLRLRSTRTDDVEISKAGSHYRARLRGRAECVFGATAEEAKKRLLTRRLGITSAPITDFEKQLLEACR